MNCAAGQDHLATVELGLLPTNHRANADATLILKEQAANLCICQNRQIGALPYCRAEISYRGRNSAIIKVRNSQRVVTVFELPVLVGNILEAGTLARLGDGLGVVGPVIGEHTADRDIT